MIRQNSQLHFRHETKGSFRAHLHQASASTLRQLCDEASDSVLIENNGVVLEWGLQPIFE